MSQTRRRPLHPNLLTALNSNREIYTKIVWHFALEVLEPAFRYDIAVGQWVDILDPWAMMHKHLTPDELPWRAASRGAQPAAVSSGGGTLGSKVRLASEPHVNHVEVGSKEEMVAAIRPEAHLPSSRPKPSKNTFAVPQVEAPHSPGPVVRTAEAQDSQAYYPLGHREEPYDPAASAPEFQRMYGYYAQKRTAPASADRDQTAVPGAVRPIAPSSADQGLDATSVQAPSLDPNQYQGDQGPHAQRVPRAGGYHLPQRLVPELAATMPSAQEARASPTETVNGTQLLNVEDVFDEG